MMGGLSGGLEDLVGQMIGAGGDKCRRINWGATSGPDSLQKLTTVASDGPADPAMSATPRIHATARTHEARRGPA